MLGLRYISIYAADMPLYGALLLICQMFPQKLDRSACIPEHPFVIRDQNRMSFGFLVLGTNGLLVTMCREAINQSILRRLQSVYGDLLLLTHLLIIKVKPRHSTPPSTPLVGSKKRIDFIRSLFCYTKMSTSVCATWPRRGANIFHVTGKRLTRKCLGGKRPTGKRL